MAGPGGITGTVVDEESLVVGGAIAMEKMFVNETRVREEGEPVLGDTPEAKEGFGWESGEDVEFDFAW